MRGVHRPLHPRTRMALADVRAAGTKAIVLLNRRGWSNFLSCRGCGHVWMCPNCEVALVLHRARGFLACHHCGHRRRAPNRCEECGSVAVARHGAGTESVEQDLREAFGSELPVFRLDADAVAGKGRLEQTLTRFEAASAGARTAAGQLGDERERPLLGSEVREAKRLVGIEHDSERDVGEVVSLGHHLGSHKHPGRRCLEAGQRLLQTPLARDGVRVEAEHRQLGAERLAQVLLDALRTRPMAGHGD